MKQDKSEKRNRGRGGSRPSFSRSFSRASQIIRKGNGRKVLVAIVLLFVSIMTTTIIVSLSTRLGTKSENSQLHSKLVRLGDVLPDSFAVEFKMFHFSDENISNIANQNITASIEWKRDVNCSFRYKEKRQESSGVEEVLLVIDNHAIIQLTIENKTTWSCFSHVQNLGFLNMFRLIVNATRADGLQPGVKCPGRLWSVQECCREIFICEVQGRIIYIQDEILMARATSFNLNITHVNVFHNHNNITCYFSTPETKFGMNHFPDKSFRWNRSWKFCVFVHGIGVDSFSSKEDIEKHYWSNARAFTTQCSNHRFIMLDSVNYGWDSVKLHTTLCRDLAGDSNIIKDTVVFAHSMGNLVLAAALFTNTCSFDSNSSEWYAIQAPWNGTKFADKLNELCKMNSSTSGYTTHEYLVKVLKDIHYCREDGNPVAAFHSLSPNYISSLNVSFQDLIKVGKIYVTGALCGYSPWGIGKMWLQSSTMLFAQNFADYDSRNDGVVPEESCEIIGNFTNSYTSKFYRNEVSSVDGTCLYEETDWCKTWCKKQEWMPWINN